MAINLQLVSVFLAVLIGSMFADTVCSIYLPADGSFGGFDHDIAGFRLGAYYLVMVAISVSLLKAVSVKLHVIGDYDGIGAEATKAKSEPPRFWFF